MSQLPCGGCFHCGISPQLSSPQLVLEMGELWKNPSSLAVFFSAISRRAQRVLRHPHSSLRNLTIVSFSLSLAAVVFSGKDAVAAYWMCNW